MPVARHLVARVAHPDRRQPVAAAGRQRLGDLELAEVERDPAVG